MTVIGACVKFPCHFVSANMEADEKKLEVQVSKYKKLRYLLIFMSFLLLLNLIVGRLENLLGKQYQFIFDLLLIPIFILLVASLFLSIKFKKEYNSVEDKIPDEQLAEKLPIKIFNERMLPWEGVCTGLVVIFFIFTPNSLGDVRFPLIASFAIVGAVLTVSNWIFEENASESKQIRVDELRVAKSKESGHLAYYLSLMLLIVLLLTILWMPEAKAQISKNFVGHEIEAAISFSIFAVLIGGLLGRFVTWDKYR